VSGVIIISGIGVSSVDRSGVVGVRGDHFFRATASRKVKFYLCVCPCGVCKTQTTQMQT